LLRQRDHVLSLFVAAANYETVNNVLSQRAGSVIRITARQRGNNQPVLDA
jgi:hypothetical protein